MEQGGSAPRILSLDDYFMVEQDKEVIEKETDRKTVVKEMVYEYEECMEISYRQSLEKAFKKTITDGFFPFIILDCINDKTKHYSEMWSFAKQNGFQVTFYLKTVEYRVYYYYCCLEIVGLYLSNGTGRCVLYETKCTPSFRN